MFQFSRKQKIWLISSIIFFVVFVAFTLVVAFVDRDGVGLSHLNQFFLQRCGQSNVWKWITNGLGYALLLIVWVLLICQIVQWLRRGKKILKVDHNLLWLDAVLGLFVAVYVFFEFVVVNNRPLGDKASYPSSHAMLFATVIPLLIWQIWHYVKNKPWRIVMTVTLVSLLLIGIVGRLLSGVHWFTDIIAGVIMGCSLDCLYLVLVSKKNN